MNGTAPGVRAELLHRSPGRLRLRVPALRRDDQALAGLANAVEAVAGVIAVTPNPLTATLLVRHTAADDEALLSELGRRTGLALESADAFTDTLAEVARSFQARRAALRQRTGIDLDPRTLAFYVLLGIGLVQLARGNVMVPATTALWYATSLLPGVDQPGPPADSA